MKIIISIILLFSCLPSFGQTEKYEYFPIEGYEAFEIKRDSFTYFSYSGLIRNRITGVISFREDTLVLNSSIQPEFSLESMHNKFLDSGFIKISLSTNSPFFFDYGLRLKKKDKTQEINLQDSGIITRKFDTSNHEISYIISTNTLEEWKDFYLIRYRTNLKIPLEWQNPNYNHFKLHFSDSAYYIDYHFFTNQKAIITNDKLILLDKTGQPEKVRTIRRRKQKIKISKKEKNKEYIKAPNYD